MTSCVVWGVASGVLSALLSWVCGWLWLRRNASSLIRGFGRGWSFHEPTLVVRGRVIVRMSDGHRKTTGGEVLVQVPTEDAFDAFAATVAARFDFN